jgi:hypothetical protein
MTRLLRAMTLAVTLSLVATISAGAASRAEVTRDQAATITIASGASLAAQATLQQGRVTVADYRIFESTDPSASLLSITGPTKHHRALFIFRENVKVCVNLPVVGGKLKVVSISAKSC